MAKMFYTLDEVCQKLGKTEDEVREMATSGQIQEFRDRDKLMFKVEQIDLLAGGDEDTGDVHLELEDTSGGSGIGLAGSGLSSLGDETSGASGLGLTSSSTGDSGADSREGTGISVFDTDHGDEGDGTRVGEKFEEEIGLEAVGSGSGLLDLTRESDDTSLGAELLEEVYSGEDNIEIPTNASGLFEAAGTDTGEEAVATAGIATMPMVVEVYDGAGSGLGIGLLLGAIAAMVCVALVLVVSLMGATSQLAMSIAENIWIWVGGLLGGTLLLGLIGWFIGKSSE